MPTYAQRISVEPAGGCFSFRLATFAAVARLRADPSSSTDGLQHNYEREGNEEKFVAEVGTQHSYGSRTQQHEDKAYREED
jgi:hypothetical protein